MIIDFILSITFPNQFIKEDVLEKIDRESNWTLDFLKSFYNQANSVFIKHFARAILFEEERNKKVVAYNFFLDLQNYLLFASLGLQNVEIKIPESLSEQYRELIEDIIGDVNARINKTKSIAYSS